MPFDHERLEVYQVALDFFDLADQVVEQLPRGRAPGRVTAARERERERERAELAKSPGITPRAHRSARRA